VLAVAFISSGCAVATNPQEISESLSPATGIEPAPQVQVGPTPEDLGTVEPDPTVTPEPPPESDPIQAVADATLKVVARGSSVATGEIDLVESSGVGTAFFISADGLAITNSHVIRNGETIQVFLPNATEPTPATLLGVSECNDLALLDVEGDGYPVLEFRQDPIRPGLRIFAAGFPVIFDDDIADIDYTLTGGIVNTVTASGDTAWASLPNAIEHDARIRGGNSGGPLVDEAGDIVGVNFANEDTNDLNLAISAVDVERVTAELRSGDFESLGIDPDALPQGQGVWVQSVRAGTEAERLGILAGDVITELGGVQLGRDGTAEEYCDAIRAAATGRQIDISVERPSTNSSLQGQINGSPLVSEMGMTDIAPPDDGLTTEPSDTYQDYRVVSDDSATLSLEVPVEFVEVEDNAEFEDNARISAAPSIDAFNTDWQAPGILVLSEAEIVGEDIDDVMDFVADGLPCTTDGVRDDIVAGPGFEGKFQVFDVCNGVETTVFHLVLMSPDGRLAVRILTQVNADRDLDALLRAVETLDVRTRDLAVVEAIVGDLLDDEEPLTTDIQEARCIALSTHDDIGAERLINAGLLEMNDLSLLELTRSEDEFAIEAVFRCVDIERLFFDLLRDLGITDAEATCALGELGINNLKEASVNALQDPDGDDVLFEDRLFEAFAACDIQS